MSFEGVKLYRSQGGCVALSGFKNWIEEITEYDEEEEN
jgi:hypothetical protein